MFEKGYANYFTILTVLVGFAILTKVDGVLYIRESNTPIKDQNVSKPDSTAQSVKELKYGTKEKPQDNEVEEFMDRDSIFRSVADSAENTLAKADSPQKRTNPKDVILFDVVSDKALIDKVMVTSKSIYKNHYQIDPLEIIENDREYSQSPVSDQLQQNAKGYSLGDFDMEADRVLISKVLNSPRVFSGRNQNIMSYAKAVSVELNNNFNTSLLSESKAIKKAKQLTDEFIRNDEYILSIVE